MRNLPACNCVFLRPDLFLRSGLEPSVEKEEYMRISTTRAIALPLTLVLLLVASSLTLSAVPQPALTNYNALFQYNGTTLFNIGVNYGFPLSPIPVSDPDGDSWGFGFSVTRDQLEMQVAPG